MKQQYQRCHRFRYISILFCLSLFLYSCDTYNFSRPQPVDKENIYEFPMDLNGYWVAEEESDSLYISKKHVDFFIREVEKIVPGAWPRLNDTGGYVYPSYPGTAFQTIEYDSLKKPVDTINNFLLKDNYAYAINGKHLLEKGYPCRINDDSIIVMKNDTVSIDLGQNAFLRRLNKDFYVLNLHIKNMLFDQNGWWQLVIIERKKDTVNLWYCNDKLLKQSSILYEYGSENYLDSKWTTTDMLRLMEEGSFSIDNRFKRAKNAGR